MSSANIPDISHGSLAAERIAVKQAMDATGSDMKRNGGVDILPIAEKEAALNLLERLAEYGMFVVQKGELESWLPLIRASGHGPAWLIEVFEKMGEDSDSPDFIKPTDDDVWKFLSEIKNWLVNPNRKGIPS